MHGRAMRILARPARPVVALCALAPLPEFIFGGIVARPLRTNEEITIARDWRRRRWALAPEEESAFLGVEALAYVVLCFEKLRSLDTAIAEVLKGDDAEPQMMALSYKPLEVMNAAKTWIKPESIF